MTGKKKKLLAGGCSYTKRIHWSSTDVIFWPEFVAEDLNLECINMGRSGAGNDFIFNSIVRGIAENDDIELVVVLWTQMFRVNMWNFQKDTINVLDTIYKPDDWKQHSAQMSRKGWRGREQEKYHKFIYDIAETFQKNLKRSDDAPNDTDARPDIHTYWIDQFIKNYLRNITTLRTLCNKLGIKLIMAQAMEIESYQSQYKRLLDFQYFFKKFAKELACSYEDSENFIGWPILSELGGNALQQYGKDLWKEENRISKKDWHPNTKGHRIIADEIYNKYKELYDKVP
jgi:hypothetical protein